MAEISSGVPKTCPGRMKSETGPIANKAELGGMLDTGQSTGMKRTMVQLRRPIIQTPARANAGKLGKLVIIDPSAAGGRLEQQLRSPILNGVLQHPFLVAREKMGRNVDCVDP